MRGAAVLVVLVLAGSAVRVPTPPLSPAQNRLVAGTALLSVRRLPAALGALAADRALQTDLGAVLAGQGEAAAQSCLVVANAGSPVLSRRAGLALVPASNLKLLTAYAVLAKLGTTGHLTTTAAATARPVAGVLDGPLYLVGGGDPLLSTPGFRASQHSWTESAEPVTRLDDLAEAVHAAGVTRVVGGVVGDDSRFDAQRELATWSPSYVATGQIGPVGALVVDRGRPALAAEGIARRSAAPDPALSAADAFAALLIEHGVAVGSPPSHAVAPPGAVVVAAVASPEVGVIVGEMVRESDNLAAEMLVKELGRAGGGGGTWVAGTQVVHDVLAGAGIPVDGAKLADGSGLDRGNRVSCATLAAVLADPGPVAATLRALLPLAGNCGTLIRRFEGQSAWGRIRAKTGSLAGVDALSGVLSTPAASPPPPCPPAGLPAPGGGDPVTFSLILNGLGGPVPSRSDLAASGPVAGSEGGVAIEDRVADAVARYPTVPPLAALSFEPPRPAG